MYLSNARQIASLSENIILLSDFECVGDYDNALKTGTDNTTNIQEALDSADGERMTIIDGGGKGYLISTGLVFNEKNIFLQNLTLGASLTWTSGTIDYTDMGSSAGGDATAGQVTNRGNPMIRAWRRDTAYTGAGFFGGGVSNFTLECNDVAPGLSIEEARFFKVENYLIQHQKGYGVAWLVKNGSSEMGFGRVREALFGEDKQLDNTADPYNSANIVLTCADVKFKSIVSHYAVWPIWADGFFNAQWSDLHFYNDNQANAGQYNGYIGPDCHGISSTNLYNDKGTLQFNSFDHSFIGGNMTGAASSTLNYAELVSQGASDEVNGLIISGVGGSTAAFNTVVTDEALGAFTVVSNSQIDAIGRDNSTASPRAGYAHNKTKAVDIGSGDWTNEAVGVERYDINLETSDLVFIDAYTTVEVVVKDRRTGSGQAAMTSWWRFVNNGGTGTKVVSVYSDIAVNASVVIRINEGLNIVS